MDRFRKSYTAIDSEQKAQVGQLKDLGETLEAAINAIPSTIEDAGRLKALALTNLETAVMYAVKAATGSKPSEDSTLKLG